ncbi:MAG: hypothetical protein SFW36_06805 [Leptolyngbyaceae cyanobacterium bins.59]|nr:hypothetical protein [Leptolyngbyaceae cyanobacterium bins.59]
MAGFGDLIQKAVYLGVGLASYAGEKAGGKLAELRVQVQKLADEMVERGEMNTEEARKFVEEMMGRAQQASPTSVKSEPENRQPRQIEILSEEEGSSSADPKVDDLRQRVLDLQEELRRLKRD